MSGWTDMFAPGSEVAPAVTESMRPTTAPPPGTFAITGTPSRITPPPTPPAEGGRTLRLWSSFGLSDLHIAAVAGSLEAAKSLLQKDPMSANKGSGFGFTPLHMACGHGHADVARLFIAAGGATEAMGDRGYTPLHLTALHGRTECAQVLLEAGADIGCVDIDGFCPIHLAARGGHDKVVELLLAWGVDPLLPGGKANSTPIHLAARFGHSKVVDTIMASRSELETLLLLLHTEDANGRTPVQVAVHKPDCQAHLRDVMAQVQKRKDKADAAAKAAALAAKKGKKKAKGKGKVKKK